MNLMDTSDQRIANLLLDMGAPSHVSGFSLLVDAIKLVIQQQDASPHSHVRVCSLYRKIANDAESTPSRVERNIRHAIQKTIHRCPKNLYQEIFRSVVLQDITNGEFLSGVAYYIRMQDADIA